MQSLYESMLDPPCSCCGCFAWSFCWTTNSDSRGVSDSFTCFWDPFPPTGLPRPAIDEHSLYPTFLPAWVVICFIDLGHSDLCEVKSHSGFDLHLPDG